MAEWNIVRNEPSYEEKLDPEIIPLCDALNAAGFVTISSCCGHGRDRSYVNFEHSTDARIEKLARFIINREVGDFRNFASFFTKEILGEGCRWCLEIRLNDVYSSTPSAEVLKKAVDAINEVSKSVDAFRETETVAEPSARTTKK